MGRPRPTTHASGWTATGQAMGTARKATEVLYPGYAFAIDQETPCENNGRRLASRQHEAYQWCMSPAKKGPKSMSKAHKDALAEGRAQSRAIKNYLEALEAQRPRRGRPRSPETMRKRLEELKSEIPEADPVKRIQLVQKRIDLENELATLEQPHDLEKLEADFIKYAASYSGRKGISYAAWRELRVPARVLKAAGITPGSAATTSS